MIRPANSLGASGPEYPIAEFVDQAGVFRNRNEFGRRDHAAFGMAPAQQRLAPRHFVALEIDDGLVMDLEAAVHHRLSQVQFHGKPGLGAGVHGRLE